MKKYSPFFIVTLFFNLAYGTPDQWTQKSSLPAQARAGAVSFALNGFGYVGTGVDSNGALLDDFWKYDPAGDSWSQVASFTGSARKNAVAFVTDSFAFVGTGYDNAGLTNHFYQYNDLNNAWTQIEDLDSAGSVYPRRDAVAFTIGNAGYVVGGYNGTSFYSSETWEYVGTRDTVWKEKTAFPMSGRRWATSFSIGGYGYVGMGYNYSQEYFHDFWKYDLSSNTWTQIADYQGNKRAYGVGFSIYGFAYVGTGFDGALKDDFYAYDPNANQWNPVTSFGGQPITGATAFSINGKGYLFGGIDTTGYKNELWEYTPDLSAGIDRNNDNQFQVFTTPNPATAFLRIESNQAEATRNLWLKLFDSSGKIVLEKQIISGNMQVSVENLKRGVYFYSVGGTSERKPAVTGKVILQ